MRVPYIVGRWVRGHNHYGRRRLINYLFTAPDTAIWVVGTRRMGKTSLLRQLELICHSESDEYIPLFIDLQGCATPQDFSDELLYAVEDAGERLAAFGIDVRDLFGQDAVRMLRTLSRALGAHERRIFLLIDEAEALLEIGEHDPNWLARLRKALQDGRQRTVMTSTKMLSRLNELNGAWTTSPFLFGFNLANLWSLDEASSIALVRQSQAEQAVRVDDATAAAILRATNRHPYLVQYLCQRLFVAGSDGTGELRPIRDDDLRPDQLLAGFFEIDFRHLSEVERRVLLTVAELRDGDRNALNQRLPELTPDRLMTFMYGLNKLGYIQEADECWRVGNEFLRRWIEENHAQLLANLQSEIDDDRVEELFQRGFNHEVDYLRREMGRLQSSLETLELQQRGNYPSSGPDLSREIARVGQSLLQVRRELAELTGERSQA